MKNKELEKRILKIIKKKKKDKETDILKRRKKQNEKEEAEIWKILAQSSRKAGSKEFAAVNANVALKKFLDKLNDRFDIFRSEFDSKFLKENKKTANTIKASNDFINQEIEKGVLELVKKIKEDKETVDNDLGNLKKGIKSTQGEYEKKIKFLDKKIAIEGDKLLGTLKVQLDKKVIKEKNEVVSSFQKIIKKTREEIQEFIEEQEIKPHPIDFHKGVKANEKQLNRLTQGGEVDDLHTHDSSKLLKRINDLIQSAVKRMPIGWNLRVKDTDSKPQVDNVNTMIFPNHLLTNKGNGRVEIKEQVHVGASAPSDVWENRLWVDTS